MCQGFIRYVRHMESVSGLGELVQGFVGCVRVRLGCAKAV